MRWQDMWQRKDQQAARALEKKDPGTAAELFQTPSWKGVAEYQAGKFSDAVDSFAHEEDADNLYNKGNALAKAKITPFSHTRPVFSGTKECMIIQGMVKAIKLPKMLKAMR